MSPAISAHRGGSENAPRGTYRAYHGALAAGAEYVEVDVRRTADGVLVARHRARAGWSHAVGSLSYARCLPQPRDQDHGVDREQRPGPGAVASRPEGRRRGHRPPGARTCPARRPRSDGRAPGGRTPERRRRRPAINYVETAAVAARC